jgi:hypothetical protein
LVGVPCLGRGCHPPPRGIRPRRTNRLLLNACVEY